MKLFSGENFEEKIAGLSWPFKLPPGWSVVWDGPLASVDSDPQD